MELNGLKTLIVGGGIGGLTAALALRQKGADVTVLEQAEAITEVGAGLQVSPNGVCVLRALGLEDGLKQLGVKARGVSLRNYRDSREVLHLDLGLLKEQSYYFLHRADLIGLLADAAREAGVKIRLLQKVESIEASETPVVHLNNGADLKADLVFLAMGFTNPVHESMLDDFGVDYDERGNVKAATEGESAYATSVDKVFAAGDMRRGQSLVVWAINEGRAAARECDRYLMGVTNLP